MVKYKRFHPDLWRSAFNFEAISSVTTISDNEMKVVGHFRTLTDYCALIFESEDWNHSYVKYETNKDYTGTILEFDPIYSGSVATFDNIRIQPSIPIESGNKTYHVVMGLNGVKHETMERFTFDGSIDLENEWIDVNSERVYYYDDNNDKQYGVRGVDYDMDYIHGKLYTDVSSIPWRAITYVEYTYNTHERFKFDFDNLYGGDHHSNYEPIPVTNIDSVSIPILPEDYQEGDRVLTGRSDPFEIVFKNVRITNGELNDIPEKMDNHLYRVAEGYDDEYDKNPKRLVDTMASLGYSEIVNFYIGASHYYDKKGKEGVISKDISDMVLDPSKGINNAFRTWMNSYMFWLKRSGFNNIVISVAMENLQMPEDWKQRLWNGEPAATGWEPPTNFYSPNSDDVKVYIRRITKEILNMAVSNGFKPILQLGESWYWWQEFIPGDINTPYEGRPPCIYDRHTVDRYKKDTGKDMPIYKNSDVFMDPEATQVANKMRQYLGEYTDFMRSIIDEYEDGLFTILFFPPSVLDEDRTPEFMRIINAPFEYWSNPNLDFIQIEDYDWVVHDDDWHKQVYMQAWRDLDYPFSKQHYFSGFAWDQFGVDNHTLWNRIEKAGEEALGRGYSEVFIWAGTQIRRDNWVNRRNNYIGDYSLWSDVNYTDPSNDSNNEGYMYVIDLEGQEYPVKATYSIKDELNGNKTISMSIENNYVNSQFINNISEMWKIVDHDGIVYKIIYCKSGGVGRSVRLSLKGIPEVFDILDSDRIYDRYDEHMTSSKAFSLILKDTGYRFIMTDSFDAIQWEGLGDGETKLESFKRALNRYGAEFEVVGNIIYIRKRIGVDTQIQYRHKLNASNITKEIDAGALWTHAKGYGDYNSGDGDVDWKKAKLKREYTSPLSKIIGVRHAPPIKNGNIKTNSSMDKELKKLVEDSLKISVTANVHSLRKQGFPLDRAGLGDRLFMIDERIDLNEEVRVISRDVTRNWKGDILDIDLTFGTEGIVKRHKSNLSTAIKNISNILDGKETLPFSVLDEAVRNATRALKSAQTELKFTNNGILAIDKTNPNNIVLLNSSGVGISRDGGNSFRTAMTGMGINADVIVVGTMLFDRLSGGTLTLGGSGNGHGMLRVLNSRDDIIAELDANKGGFDELRIGDVISESVVKVNRSNYTIYVNPLIGSDNNDGLSRNRPFESIRQALDSIPKYNQGIITIDVDDNIGKGVSIREAILFYGFLGNGTINLNFGNKKTIVDGWITVTSCTNTINIKDVTVRQREDNQDSAIRAWSSTIVNFENIIVRGASSANHGAYIHSSNVELRKCEFYNIGGEGNCITGATHARVNVVDCKGVGKVGLRGYNGAMFSGGGTQPRGDVSKQSLTRGAFTHSTFTEDPPREVTPDPQPELPPKDTVRSWNTTYSETWRTYRGGQWAGPSNGRDVLQGQWANWGLNKGMWFFGESLHNTVKGKTIKRIRVRLTRTNNSGSSGAVSAIIRPHKYANKPSGEPSYLNATHSVSFRWGESKWVTLPSSFNTLFSNGQAYGIGIHTTSTNSSNYMRFKGNVEMEITYA